MVVSATLKYDELEVENVAQGHSLSATFSTEGFIIFQCHTHYHASSVYCKNFRTVFALGVVSAVFLFVGVDFGTVRSLDASK